MADVSFERKKSVSRQEAISWLAALTAAFEHGGKAELPVGGGGTVTVHLPDHVEAEFEVQVDGDQVEIELEFSWSVAKPE